jgi:hypothetical protein
MGTQPGPQEAGRRSVGTEARVVAGLPADLRPAASSTPCSWGDAAALPQAGFLWPVGPTDLRPASRNAHEQSPRHAATGSAHDGRPACAWLVLRRVVSGARSSRARGTDWRGVPWYRWIWPFEMAHDWGTPLCQEQRRKGVPLCSIYASCCSPSSAVASWGVP